MNTKLKEVANSTAEEFAAALTEIEARLGEAVSRLDDARISVSEKVQEAADVTQEYVREHPWKVALGVVAAGLIVGLVLSRR